LARYQQNIKVVTLCGGQSIGPQIGSLEHGAHIVVGTPGRITDHLRKQTLTLDRVTTLVLDEADRMLEMGFIEDITAIIQSTPPQRQTLLFSATYPEDIGKLSAKFQRSPQRVTAQSLELQSNIEERFFICSKHTRLDSLLKLMQHFRPQNAVIFCNTKQLVREVTEYLEQHQVVARALHGDMEQRDRDQVLMQFRQQSCSVLVATDVAARGLDIDDLPAVINFELPRNADTYVHRIGRTGRAGKQGLALSLFMDSERYKLDKISEQLARPLSFDTAQELPVDRRPIDPPAFVTLCIAGGKKQKVRAGDILGALTGEAGIPGSAVGKIAITDFQSYVAITRDEVNAAQGRLLNGKIKGRKFKVRRL
jgi:ATP-independent RNA helicase DbpA